MGRSWPPVHEDPVHEGTTLPTFAPEIPDYLTRSNDLDAMVWFLHKPGELTQSRIPDDSGACTLTQCGIKTGARLLCEWPRRELQPQVGDPAERFPCANDFFGTKVIAGRYDTPCGSVSAGVWRMGAWCMWLLFAFAIFVADSIHNDCDVIPPSSGNRTSGKVVGCGQVNAVWDGVGYIFLLIGCIMAALPCCGNELREAHPPQENNPCSACGPRLISRSALVACLISGYFIGTAVHYLPSISKDEKQPPDPWVPGTKSDGRLICEWVGQIIQWIFGVLISLYIICVKRTLRGQQESERFLIRITDDAGAAGLEWPYRYNYQRGNISIQLPDPAVELEAVVTAEHEEPDHDVPAPDEHPVPAPADRPVDSPI